MRGLLTVGQRGQGRVFLWALLPAAAREEARRALDAENGGLRYRGQKDGILFYAGRVRAEAVRQIQRRLLAYGIETRIERE